MLLRLKVCPPGIKQVGLIHRRKKGMELVPVRKICMSSYLREKFMKSFSRFPKDESSTR